MLGILWAKGLQPSIAPGILAAPQGVSVFPFSNKPPSGMETCPAPFQGPGMLGAGGRGWECWGQVGPEVHFSLVWPLDWMGSESASDPGPLGLSEGPESSVWPQNPLTPLLHPCLPPRIPTAPGQTTDVLLPAPAHLRLPRVLSPRQAFVSPISVLHLPFGWHLAGVRYAN